MFLELVGPLRSLGAVDGVYLMLCLSANVDTLLSISIIVPRPAGPFLHSQSVGFDTLVLDTSNHGAGHGPSVFLQSGRVPFLLQSFLYCMSWSLVV